MNTDTKRKTTTRDLILVLAAAVGIVMWMIKNSVESNENIQANQGLIESSVSHKFFTNRFLVELPVDNGNMQFDNITSQLMEMGFKKKQSKKITEALKEKIDLADSNGELQVLWVKYYCKKKKGNSSKTRILEFAIDVDGNIEIVKHFTDNLETFLKEDPRLLKANGNEAINFERCCLREIEDNIYFDCEGKLVYVSEALYKNVLSRLCEKNLCLY